MTINIKKAVNVTAVGIHTGGNSKPVFCITDGSVYASVTDAAEKNNVSLASMSHAVCGRQKTCQGKRYCFISDVMHYFDEISENFKIRQQKVEAYDAMIAEENAKKQAQENIARHKARCEELREKLAKEEQLLKEAEAICAD